MAIKMVEWVRVNQARGRLLEDPVKEVAAMQLIGTEHPNVLGSQEVLQDDDYLFSIMPFAKGGDLFGYVVRDTELRGGDGGMTEPVARYWFKQILEVSGIIGGRLGPRAGPWTHADGSVRCGGLGCGVWASLRGSEICTGTLFFS